MEEDEWVLVEFGVEVVKKEVILVEASTLVMGFSIEKVRDNMAEMVDWWVEDDMEEHKAMKEVWATIYE